MIRSGALGSILRGSGDIATSSILQQVISVAAFLILVRRLDAEGYGAYAVIISLAATLFAFAGNWVTPYLVSEGSRQYKNRGSLGDVFWGCSAFSMVCCFSFLPALILSLPYGKIYFVSTALLLLGVAGLTLLRCGYQILGDFRGYGRFIWLDRSIFLTGLLFFGLFGAMGAAEAVALLVFSQLISLSVGIKNIHHRIDWKSRDLVVPKFIFESLPIMLASIAAYFSSPPFAILIFAKLFGASAAGAIAAAFVLAGFTGQPAMWLAPVLLPRFALGGEGLGDVRAYLSRLLIPTIALYVGMIAFAALMMPFVINVLGGGFQPYESLFVAIIATAPPETIHVLLVPVLLGRGKGRVVMYASLLRAFVFLSVSFSPLAAHGIALSLPIAAWFGVIFELWSLRAAISLNDWNSIFACLAFGVLVNFGYGWCIAAAVMAAGILWIRNREFPFIELIRAKTGAEVVFP